MSQSESSRFRIIDVLHALIKPEQKRLIAMNLFGELISSQGLLSKISSAYHTRTYTSSNIVYLGSPNKKEALDHYQIEYGSPLFADIDAYFGLKPILQAIDKPREKFIGSSAFNRIKYLSVLTFLVSFVPTIASFLIKAAKTETPLKNYIVAISSAIILSIIACFVIYLLLRIIPVRSISNKNQQETDNTILKEIYCLSLSSTESWGPLAKEIFKQVSLLLDEETKQMLQATGQSQPPVELSNFSIEVGPAEKIVRLASAYYQTQRKRLQEDPSYSGPNKTWGDSYKDLSRWACAKAAEDLNIRIDGSGDPCNSISDSLRKCCEAVVGSADRDHAQQHVRKMTVPTDTQQK